MAPRTPRPRPAPENPGHDAEGTPRPLSDFPLLDADGTTMSLGNRVEQVVVEETHGALRSRLHQHGEIIGRNRHLVYVRFDQEWRQHLVTLRPHHLRLLDAPDGH